MGCVLCSEVVWERSEVGGRTIRSGCELGNREECFQRWRVLAMGPLAAAARFGRGKHHCHLICALGRWRRRDADDDDGADQSADEELLQCDLSLDFGMGDREKSAAAATALEVAEEHALPLSSNPRSHSPSWQPHSPFQPRCLSPLGVSFRFLQFRNSFLFSSVFLILQSSLSLYFFSQDWRSLLFFVDYIHKFWSSGQDWELELCGFDGLPPPTLLPRTLKRRQAAGGETWSAPVGKMEGERVTDEERKKEEGGDGGRWIEAVQKLIGLTMCFVFGCWIVTLATFPTTHMLNYLNTSVLMNKSTSFGFSGTPTFVF